MKEQIPNSFKPWVKTEIDLRKEPGRSKADALAEAFAKHHGIPLELARLLVQGKTVTFKGIEIHK